MKLSDYAKKYSVTYRTAWNRFKAGKIPGAYLDETNHVVIDETKSIDYSKCAIYCRVSTNKQKQDLENQLTRVKNYAISNGYTIEKAIKEIASGVNDSRKKLTNLLQDDSWNTLIVEHQDRLTRFGFNYIKILLENNYKKIIVINKTEDEKHDLMSDMVSVLYSFAARMYSKRKISKQKIEKTIKELNK